MKSEVSCRHKRKRHIVLPEVTTLDVKLTIKALFGQRIDISKNNQGQITSCTFFTNPIKKASLWRNSKVFIQENTRNFPKNSMLRLTLQSTGCEKRQKKEPAAKMAVNLPVANSRLNFLVV